MSERLVAVLKRFVLDVTARAMVGVARQRVAWQEGDKLDAEHHEAFIKLIQTGLQTFGIRAEQQDACLAEIRQILTDSDAETPSRPEAQDPSHAHKMIFVERERDVVITRMTARDLSAQIGFNTVDQTKIATIVSELTRNIIHYAGTGEMTFSTLHTPQGVPDGIEIEARDQGPGITHLDDILAGRYRSRTGMGMGLLGVQRLADHTHIHTTPGEGTTVTVQHFLRSSPRKPR